MNNNKKLNHISSGVEGIPIKPFGIPFWSKHKIPKFPFLGGQKNKIFYQENNNNNNNNNK